MGELCVVYGFEETRRVERQKAKTKRIIRHPVTWPEPLSLPCNSSVRIHRFVVANLGRRFR